MRNFAYTMMLLALGTWIGAMLFFGAAVAPTVFAVLSGSGSGRSLAGDIVGRSLTLLHALGFTCGVIFFVGTQISQRVSRLASGLVLGMLVLTAASELAISPRVRALRAQIAREDAARQSFDRWHATSTAVEGVVLLGGLGAFGSAAKRN